MFILIVSSPAYGTYKLAKKMSKGLHAEYDDDDCWEFDDGRFECQCDECNVYVGGAAAVAASFATVASAALLSLYCARYYNGH